jgi:hypothetical protein
MVEIPIRPRVGRHFATAPGASAFHPGNGHGSRLVSSTAAVSVTKSVISIND